MIHTFHKQRFAFSLLELIFVIVILGIVASIGSEIIAQVYKSYIIQRAQYRATTKTELALQQIANRLHYAIPGTVISRPDKIGTATPITDIGSANANDKVLQWVGYDGDSFEAISSSSNRKPGWSGFCDIDAYTGNTILQTPGSNLDLATTIISNLGGDIANANIFFPHSTAAFGVASGTGENITLDSAIPSGTTIYERYKLAWSSYALEVDGNGDLILHYNFTPDIGSTINGNSSILLHHVTNFRFKGSEGSLRIKICKWERIAEDANITACKEKVIF
ncbi:type II secretion system protein [Sulfurovum sp.]|uniref:PulJ/GspJ family protein n=1 Tax=Sulfurovum sp. TaxID=1969726 RepID=UPI0025E97568|nr:type II secretion system protein [Sulfurovum sp.]